MVLSPSSYKKRSYKLLNVILEFL